MSFTYSKAKREGLNVIIGLAGASGSGKTYSAMVLAEILSGDRPFRVGDTEMKRALHYADSFDFEHELIRPPFTSQKYLDFILETQKRGFRAAVIDSMSHEWDGQGGCLELADAIESGHPIPGVYEKKGTRDIVPLKSPGNWKEPKRRHLNMMNAFLQADMHLIFCLRAHEKIEMIDNPEYDADSPRRGVTKTLVNQLGWSPICEKNFMFDMTLSFVLHPDKPGIVDYAMAPKLADDFKMMFPEGQHIGRPQARAMLAWSGGASADNPNAELWKNAREIAQEGTMKIRDYMQTEVTKEEYLALGPIRKELWASAQAADSNMVKRESEEAGPNAPPADDAPNIQREHERQAPPPSGDDFPGDRPSKYDTGGDNEPPDRPDF